jgi:hypothetical protein
MVVFLNFFLTYILMEILMPEIKIKKVFVYTEVQLSIPFDQAPWRELNPILLQQPGLVNKTWLSGYQNNSVGGIYEFNDIENAFKFAHEYFPAEAKKLGAPFTLRIFNGDVVEEASRQMNSVHFKKELYA